MIFYDNLKNTTYMHFLVTEGHISTCHFQVDALSNHKMVLVAAGEAHSGAVDMNGSLEQRFQVFHDVFRWVLDKLGILVRKHMEGWQFLADWKRISFPNLTVTKRGCFSDLLGVWTTS